MSFFKKALSSFVEFEEDPAKPTEKATTTVVPTQSYQTIPTSNFQANVVEAEKFEKYFDKMLDDANLPGPDYYEFFKTSETLRAHLADENARISSAFAVLKIQGLTKEKLLETAGQYKLMVEKDRTVFEEALKQKLAAEVGERQNKCVGIESQIKANLEQIQNLAQANSENQTVLEQLKKEIVDEENKIKNNNNGYLVASQAINNKISEDIKKIQTIL